MDNNDIALLRRLPIEEVAGRLGLEPRQHKCLCPFHNDHHASLTFSPRRNTFRCWACGEHGGVIDLAMRCLGMGFAEACRWLSASASLLPPAPAPAKPLFDPSRYEPYFARPWLSAAACDFLFARRCIDPRVVRWCRLTTWRDRQGREWLQIPYLDRQGHLTGIQNRNLGPGEPRFRFPAGSECGLYNLPVLGLLRPSEPLYIAEGCSDCWALLSAGHKAVAVPSATLLKPATARLLQELADTLGTPFHIFPDADEPGERLFGQLRRLLPSIVRHSLPPGCKDFADLYAGRCRKEAAHE